MELADETLADWVSRLVQIPSVNPEHAGEKAGVAGEAAMAEALGNWFTEFGGEATLHEVEPGRPNVYGRFEGETDRLVAIDVHTDTVGVEHMTDPPFDGRIEGDRVWGRGSVDTKASMGVLLAVLEQLHREGRRPRANVMAVGTISEEAGGLLGAVGFAEWLRDRSIVIDQLIVAEPTDCQPIHGHKGGVGLLIDVIGEAAHTSKPELGQNAIVGAAEVIQALQAEHERIGGLTAPTPMGNGTITVSLIEGGTAPNIVPDRCSLTVGRRIAPGEDPVVEFDRLAALCREACSLPLEIEMRNGAGSPAFYQEPESSLIERISRVGEQPPGVVPYGTNALKYDGVANEMVVLGPGSIDVAHKAQEYVDISELRTLARIYEDLLLGDG